MSTDHTNTAPTNQSSPPEGSGRRLRGTALASVLTALLLTLLLEALDQTIVGTALPKITAYLQGLDRYTWVVTAYLLASTTMIPIIGKISDQFGRKWLIVTGVVIFLAGSALSGAAQTMNELIAFRAIQGLGAGTGIALVFTVVGDIFPPAERAKWQGIFSSVYGFSSVVGPTVGGWLTDHGPLLGNLVVNATRWRWVFYINIPIGIAALIVLMIYLPSNISTRSNALKGWAAFRRIDFLGALLASSATICLLLGLTWGSDQIYAWNSVQVIAILVASVVLYAAFVISERFAAEPILPLDLFRNQVFAADSLLSLASGMVLLSLVIYLPFYLQGVLGESATNSGEVITPLTVSLTIGSMGAGFVIARIGRYHLITLIGSIVLTIGVFLMTSMSATTPLLDATIFMIIAGVGLGMFFSVMTLAVQNALPRRRMGVGTGAMRYLSALGQTLGVAVAGTVVNNTIATELAKRLPASAARQLTPTGLQFATNTEVLVSPAYRNTVVSTAKSIAIHDAVAKATAHVPPGPYHAQTVAAITQKVSAQVSHQVAHLLNQVFDALRLSLAVAIQHSFVATLIFCAGVIVAAIFLKDVPLRKTYDEGNAGMKQPDEEALLVKENI
jgi:EmrB/QacA subfamily drug resistance transporter